MKSLKYLILILTIIFTAGCSRADEDLDVLSQEDISNIILNVKDDETGITQTYNYTVNSATNPVIKLTDGKTYTVNAVFLNGNEDETESIIAAKDEHFLIFDFHGSIINFTRIDDESSTRTDGNKLGLVTKWEVVKAANSSSPELVLTLIHDAVSVSEVQNGTAFGTANGGETDAVATFGISN
ncbi:hypothetical protein [Chryseobacterium koreense]|uniref:Lipoprotein n=1 Tax=Chryseobacterium koreense CCUG 49689 TaxID=1304281 RepID=A0A0J7J351_9FLAO|nr:hypothetical protein [Chryseobacterium koreense]KMQ72464.1 hypothetical protein ACM44_01615 [Chryseobacterium koreense CCUG 49689]MBB5333443.1 hypothetical protein [Chryseobacterium koreense]